MPTTIFGNTGPTGLFPLVQTWLREKEESSGSSGFPALVMEKLFFLRIQEGALTARYISETSLKTMITGRL